MPTPNDDFTTETHAGQQAEQAAYEQLKDAIELLDSSNRIEQQTVDWWLQPATGQPPEKLARALERFESRLAAGEWPTRPDGHTAASAPTVQEIRRQLRQLAHLDPPDPLTWGPPQPKERLRCRQCGQTGSAGAYPFSTLPGSDTCDDCL